MALYLSGIRNSERIASGNFELAWLTEGTAVAVLIADLWFGASDGCSVAAALRRSHNVIRCLCFSGFRHHDRSADHHRRCGSAALDDIPTVVWAVLRVAIAMFLVLIITGRADAKLASQVRQTQSALDLARAQQDILLRGDEFTRRQISGALHDRVQARLIAACLELQMVDVNKADETQRTVNATIAQLEEIRSVDVRRVARALSPRLNEVDLESALDELALQYEPGMKSTITVDSVIENKETRPSVKRVAGCLPDHRASFVEFRRSWCRTSL